MEPDIDNNNINLSDFDVKFKGVAFIRHGDDFNKFIVSLGDTNGPFETAEEWAAFFCDGTFDEYSLWEGADIETLVPFVDPAKAPTGYPALICFDFDKYISSAGPDSAVWIAFQIRDLGIRSIETEKDDFSVLYTL